MEEAQLRRVKGGAGDQGGVLRAVEEIPGEWMAQVGHMDPDLVGTAGLQLQAEEGAAMGGSERLVPGAGGLAVGSHPPGDEGAGHGADGGVDKPGGRLGNPLTHRQVEAAEVRGVQGVFQHLLGVGVLGDHQQAAGTYPAGVAVLFTTDSRRIEARWTTAPRNYGWNMTPVLQRGMDLYVRENGVWTMAGAARPGLQDRHASTIVEHMDGQPKECMLYLPAWSELLTLEIGVDEGASVTPLESPYKHRVIVFGSSVTHGASASRPGMTYPARMSRMTGIEFVNLGYSGNCMLQPEFARLLAETDADAFLFDAFSNPSPKMIRERLDAFVATLVKAHPDKPLIFMQTHWHTAGNLDQEAAKFHRERIDTADGMMRRLAKQYDNVYFLDGEWFFGRDAEGTIDCDHGSDLGYDRMISERLPRIRKILRKYGIR